jgi:GAF domain-containing protein
MRDGGTVATVNRRESLATAGRNRIREPVTAKATHRGHWQESAHLHQIIETISSGPDLSTILRGIVNLVTEATGCHACFIYFIEQDRFVLRAASSMYAHLEGSVQFGRDEGLAGWVARTRRSAFIRERALQDPRVLYIAELEEERFQSLVSVPILARSSEVAGVISVHASAPHEFRHADREFLESTASLVAGAIENARLYEDATKKVAILSELSRLAQRIAAAGTPDELLHLAVNESRRLLNARRCELYLIEAEEQLVLAQASPARGGDRPQDLRQLWTSLFDSSKESQAATQVAAEILRGDRADGAPVVAPLVAGTERLGLLAVFLDRPEPDARWVVGAVASHTAVAMKHLRLVDWLRQKNLARDFLEALAHPGFSPDELAAMAVRLGCNLQAPHLVLAATPRPQSPTARAKDHGHRPADGLAWDDLVGRLEVRLRADFQGCLLDRRGEVLRGLFRVGSAGPGATLEALRKVVRDSGDLDSLAIGVSETCRGREELAHGFEEADYAARMGPLMKAEADVSSYPELGAYRYVLASASGVRDGSLERLARLVDYERRRGTELLRTLKVYLDHRGNIARTARALYMHPNTLRQRLARIAAVADIDLEREDWVSLAMALRVVELRQLQGAPGRVDDDQ